MVLDKWLGDNGYMPKTPPPNRLAELRKKHGLTQQELADRVGAHWITISKLERGVIGLSDEWRVRLGEALQEDQYDLLLKARRLPTVHVLGQIVGGRIEPIDEGKFAYDLDDQYFFHPDYRWVRVADHTFYPWFQPGDLVCLFTLGPEEYDQHLHRVCATWFDNGEGVEQMAVGVLEPGTHRRTYSIRGSGAPPIYDVKPTGVSVVAMAVYDVLQPEPGAYRTA